MRRTAFLLLLTTVSCASAHLVQRDAIEVAKAPRREWKKVAAGGLAVGAALLVDDEVARIVRNNDSSAVDDITDAIEPFGGGHSDKVMAALLLYGVVAKNAEARATAFDAIVSSIFASKVITPALKQSVHRARPNGGDESFPSNHATQAFAIASVFASHSDRAWVRGTAYGVAGAVAFSRVYHEAHWTSDVVAGALIGSLVGTTVVRTNQGERAKWRVVPAVSRDGVGIVVTRR